MLKHTADIVTLFLTHLFNVICNSGSFPSSWSQSLIIPLHKSGSLHEPGNYRGISLINSLTKVFIGLLTEQLTKWVEENNIIHEEQSGFRQNYSVIDNTFALQSLAQKYLSKRKGRFYCLFIDFKKAFDSIDHNRLWDSLTRKGLNGKILHIFQSMYRLLNVPLSSHNIQYITQFFDCEIGMRQGCLSSTLLVSLFINDLVDLLKIECNQGIYISDIIDEILSLLFADDVSTFADTVLQLQKQLDVIDKFCDSTGMSINLEKLKVIVFRNGGILRKNEKWFYKGKEIEVVPYYKYLGTYFSSRLCWSKTLENQSDRAKKVCYIIYSYQRKFVLFKPVDAFKLFDAMVKPVLCFAADIWGHQYYNAIEKVHLQFCKRMCHLKHNTSNSFVLGECGRSPLAVYYITQCIKY